MNLLESIPINEDDSEEDGDIVKKFMVNLFKMADKSQTCPKELKKFIKNTEKFPNRAKLRKMIEKITTKTTEEGTLII